MIRELAWDEIDLDWNDIQNTWDMGVLVTSGGSSQYSPVWEEEKDQITKNVVIKQVIPVSTLLIKKIGVYTKIKDEYYTKSANKLNIKAKIGNLTKIPKSIKIKINN
jgi:hypothetical protein